MEDHAEVGLGATMNVGREARLLMMEWGSKYMSQSDVCLKFYLADGQVGGRLTV